MGRIYTVSWTGDVAAADGDVDWLEVLPADDKPVKLRGFLLSQTTEVGDAMEEGLRFSIVRLGATVTSGTGNATTNTESLDSADTAAGFAAEGRNTAVATTSGTTDILAEFAWNVRASPYEVWFPDERFAPKAKQGEGLFIRQQTTVADTITCCFTAWLEEE